MIENVAIGALMPFHLVLSLGIVLGVGYVTIVTSSWYTGAPIPMKPVAWYAWPWNWPGNMFAEHVISALSFIQPTVPMPENPITTLVGLMVNMGKIGLAFGINITVAMAPLKALRFVTDYLVTRRNKTKALKAPSCESLQEKQ